MFLKHFLDWIPFGSVPEITSADLARAMDGQSEGLQLLDVRTQREFGEGHLANARHAPVTSLSRELDDLSLDARRRVVAICASGHRSVVAVRLLRRRGFVEAVQLAGGMSAWRAAGLEVIR